VREVALARKESNVGATLEGSMHPDRSAQNREPRFEGIQELLRGNLGSEIEFDLAGYTGQGAQIAREPNPDHGRT
jgi:hypothetical protein